MSEKKEGSKSKSKEKAPAEKAAADKPPTKAKKSAGEASKKAIQKPPAVGGAKGSKIDPNESQTDLSFFKPLLGATNSAPIDEALCRFHKASKNSTFCEICQQPACPQCAVYGPHNNQMHRLLPLDEAYTSRYNFLNQLICEDLIGRREEINTRLKDLTALAEELRFHKSSVEKATKVEYSEMMDRLKVSAGGKFALLHHEMAELQKDLEAINSLGNEFFELTSMNPAANAEVTEPNPNPVKGMVPFLLRSRFLQEDAEQLISKPIKTTVDVYPYDLPRELTEKKLILERNQPWLDLITAKDQCIWHLVQERKQIKEALALKHRQLVQVQLMEWKSTYQKVRNEIKATYMHCQECNTAFDENSANQNCSRAIGQPHFFIPSEANMRFDWK